MKITNIHPRVVGSKEQQPIEGTEEDALYEIACVWDRLRNSTLMDENVLFPETNQSAIDDFREQMEKDRFDLERVKFLTLDPIEKTIHIPASQGRAGKLVRRTDGAVVNRTEPHAATTKTITVDRYLDWGKRKDVRYIASKAKDFEVVVVYEPDVDGGDLDYLSELPADTHVVIFHLCSDKYGVVVEGGAENWRASCYSITELPKETTNDFIEHLLPEMAYTKIPAPSYTGKTHIAIEMGVTLVTAGNFLGHFKGPNQPVPVTYHVPELSAGRFKEFLQRLNVLERLKGKEEMFLVRPLEVDLWQLDSPPMVESSRGRFLFLDTFGYFNDGDDTSNYNDAINFAKKVNNLIRQGCLGVCGLYHPPKYAKKAKETGNVLTLENQILGSAGYGGLLRSCLAMRNLHDDYNKGLWVYVQGLKNPGLSGPFQIKGFPLELVKKPGDSPYLSELLSGDTKYGDACVLFNKKVSQREVAEQLDLSLGKVNKMHKQWEKNDSDFQGEATYGTDFQ